MRHSIRLSRQFSQRAVMETILQGGPISRASIAKLTRLSKQTISEIVRQLEGDGWIKQSGRTSGHVGRTAVTYELVPSAAFIIAVDLGGTKVRVAIADLACRVIGEEVALTDPRVGGDVIAQIAGLCRSAAARRGIAWERIRLAVVGVPGAPQADGRVLLAPNIARFDGMDVAAAIEAALGIDVRLENDVNLSVYGESWMGNGQGIDDLAFIALGTGIGGGLMVGGELVRGGGNAAGELGFLPFGADPFDPESLRAGALERVVASAGIRSRYRALSGRSADVPEIFSRAGEGDASAMAVLDETARHLTRGIAAICVVANPQKVILGGSIGIRPEIIARVRELLPQCVPTRIAVEASALGPQASIVGATAIGLSHLHNSLFAADAPDRHITLPRGRGVSFLEAMT